MINNYLQFISNNVKGLQSLEKRVKVFEYLKNCISNNGFMFLQEISLTGIATLVEWLLVS